MNLDDEFDNPEEKRQQQILWFKENILLFRQLNEKCLKKISKTKKKPVKPRTYRVVLMDSGDNEGNFLEISKDISAFEYAEILSNIFGLEVEINYSEDFEEGIIANGLSFEGVDDLLDFLSRRDNESDEE